LNRKTIKPRVCGALFLTPIFDAMKNFAIVGAGEVAKLHAKNIQRKGKLVAVCGDDELERETLAIEHGAKAYGSFDEMLASEKETDVVVVCSAVGFHAEHIIKSLQAGKDVLCESPLCLTKAAAWQIIETEKYCAKRVYLIQTPSFFSPFKHQKKNEWKNHIGQIQSFQLDCTMSLNENFLSGPDGQKFPGGGLLYKPFGLVIDLLISHCGEIKTAEGFLKFDNNGASTVENTGVAVLKMQNGSIGTFHWSSVMSRRRQFAFVAENAVGDMEIDEPELLQMQADSPLTAKTIEGLTTKLYKAVYDDLSKALRGKDVKFPTTLDGAKTVEAIEKIYKALR